MRSIKRHSILLLSLIFIGLFTGCSIYRTAGDQPLFEREIKHNVLDQKDVFNPWLIARRARSNYIVINSQDDLPKVSKPNTIYSIKADINLNGALLKIPTSCLLFFDGGSFSNGTVEGDNTIIVSKDYEIFKHGISTYKAYQADSYKYVTKNYNAIVISGTWLNTKCGDMWTGMSSQDDNHCSSLAINNYIKLHKWGQEIVFPKDGVYYVYDHINCSGYSFDFNGSVLRSIDFDRVEDLGIRLPEGVQPREMKSLYGLVVFTGDNLYLKNLTIDGRASQREERLVRGTECLISMASNKSCKLINVKLEDAIGCGICTYAISNCLFQNLTINSCGEHGIYTHAYTGSLCFNNCNFIDCGRDPVLFSERGASACVNFSGSRDRGYSALKELRASFTDCLFEFNLESQYVATFYSDITKVVFNRCKWKGNVKGYSIVSPKLSEQTNQLVELTFVDCDNPCFRINSVNTIRRLIRCTNVVNPFSDAIELTDCEIHVGYADVENKYTSLFSEQYDMPVICKNCIFIKGPNDTPVRNTIKNPRPMVFDHCKWDFAPSKAEIYKGTFFLVLTNQEDSPRTSKNSVDFISCEIDIDKYRLLSSKDTDIYIEKCNYINSYDILVDSPLESPNRIRVINMMNRNNRKVTHYSVLTE